MVVGQGKKDNLEFGVCIRGRQVFCSCSDFYERGVHCEHIAAVALHELEALAQTRSEWIDVVKMEIEYIKRVEV